MLSTSLSKRRDLVEGLDADAILDYLTHHGVLDPSVLVNLEKQNGGDPPTSIQRNSAILRHVEAHGDTAVALFINALRQSGQLHLANSLDTEQRIKPMSGEGYLDKPRHKGEIVVRLSVEALKILAPREPPSERNVNLNLLTSPYGEYNSDMVDSDEDQIKPKSCWCFCVSRKRRTRSSSKKARSKNRYEEQLPSNPGTAPYTQPSHFQQGIVNPYDSTVSTQPLGYSEQNLSGTNNFNGSKTSAAYLSPSNHSSTAPGASPVKEKKKKAKSKSKSSGKQNVPGTTEDPRSLSSPVPPDHAIIHSQPKGKSTDKGKEKSSKQKKNESKQIPQDLNLSKSSDPKKRTKDGGTDGIFMEYDSHLELVKLRAGHDELASPTRQSGPMGIMVEQWKSSGKHFLIKSDLLCRAIVEEFLTDIIKYFEQERGTLVLDVVSEATSVTVFNICMTKNQVAKLDKDHVDGSLLEKLQEVFMSRLDISKFDIRGVRFCTEVDRNQLKSVLSEL